MVSGYVERECRWFLRGFVWILGVLCLGAPLADSVAEEVNVYSGRKEALIGPSACCFY